MLHRIPTGCIGIDKALGGGIACGSVCLIYGEAETGKSTLATQCAFGCAVDGQKSLYVDCDGMFSAERLSQVASDKFREIAKLVILMKPVSFQQQSATIDNLAEYLSKNFGLVVIDTVTSLYGAALAEKPGKAFELNRELNRQLASLAQVARTQKVAIVMTSQVRTSFKEFVSVEPVATRVLKFWADTVLNLKPAEKHSAIRVLLEKPLTGHRPLEFNLMIGRSGIHEHRQH